MELVGLGDLKLGSVGADKACHCRRRRHSIVYLLLLFWCLLVTPCLFLCAVVFEFCIELPAQNDKWKLSIQCSGELKGQAAAVYFHKDIVDHPDLVSVRPHAPPDNPSP